jgi:phosphate transport system permease protein
VEAASIARAAGHAKRRIGDRIGDQALHWITAAAAFGSIALLIGIAYKVIDQARPAWDKFGFAFIWHQAWNPNTEVFGALDFIYGTAVSSFVALLFAAPISIAIALYLSELAPSGVKGIVGALVETLAAVPSVVIGLWGILVLGPVVEHQLEPALGSVLGWLPLFQGQHGVQGMLPAIIVLTIMIVPITSSISRELFTTVPRDLKEGAYGLGLTRWEMVRGVVLPYTRGGVIAATLLGMGRAVGEAIAVTQVIGAATGIHISFFKPADTLASRIANQYQGASSGLQVASLVYLAAILLVFALVTNIIAQVIVSRFEVQRA